MKTKVIWPFTDISKHVEGRHSMEILGLVTYKYIFNVHFNFENGG